MSGKTTREGRNDGVVKKRSVGMKKRPEASRAKKRLGRGFRDGVREKEPACLRQGTQGSRKNLKSSEEHTNDHRCHAICTAFVETSE